MKRRRRRINPETVALLKQIGVGILIISVLALLVTGVWYGTRWEKLTINEVEARGGETIELKVIEKMVQTSLEGTYLGLIPYRFAWLYPHDRIVAQVDAVERIHNVSVDRWGNKRLLVTFDEYVPASLWCNSLDSSVCVFLDKHAFAFAIAPQLSGGSYQRIVTLDREAKVGESVLSQDEYDSIRTLNKLLADQGWYVSGVEIDAVNDLYLKIVGGGELKVSLAEEAENIVDNLLTVLASDDFSHIKPGNFQYIDLRFGNKVFVNEELAAPIEEAASEPTATTSDDSLEH